MSVVVKVPILSKTNNFMVLVDFDYSFEWIISQSKNPSSSTYKGQTIILFFSSTGEFFSLLSYVILYGFTSVLLYDGCLCQSDAINSTPTTTTSTTVPNSYSTKRITKLQQQQQPLQLSCLVLSFTRSIVHIYLHHHFLQRETHAATDDSDNVGFFRRIRSVHVSASCRSGSNLLCRV